MSELNPKRVKDKEKRKMNEKKNKEMKIGIENMKNLSKNFKIIIN